MKLHTRSVEQLCQFINSVNSSSIIVCGILPTKPFVFSIDPDSEDRIIRKGRPRKRCKSSK